MSEKQLKAFLEKVKADSRLQEIIKAAKSPDEVVAIAKDHGHDFTSDKISQLREEELEEVAGAGGRSFWWSVGCGTCAQQNI